MSHDSSWNRPRFERPPVVETAFSIEFVPLPGWQIPFFGLYWQTIRPRYPKLNVQAAIPSQIEDLDNPSILGPAMSFGFTGEPPVRCWFYNESETQLIQIQNNRFIFNWKRGIADEPYPHFETIRPAIASEWSEFVRFVGDQRLGYMQPQQCEITYINHIEIGLGWKDYSEMDEVFPAWSGLSSMGFLPQPQDVEINARYLMPERQGRLYVHAQPAIRNIDQKEIIQLTLVSRGKPAGQTESDVFAWFDSAQEFTSRGFLDFTSTKMHALWGVRSGQ